jgi:hypothetical protein
MKPPSPKPAKTASAVIAKRATGNVAMATVAMATGLVPKANDGTATARDPKANAEMVTGHARKVNAMATGHARKVNAMATARDPKDNVMATGHAVKANDAMATAPVPVGRRAMGKDGLRCFRRAVSLARVRAFLAAKAGRPDRAN